jgi:hypothetical protein
VLGQPLPWLVFVFSGPGVACRLAGMLDQGTRHLIAVGTGPLQKSRLPVWKLLAFVSMPLLCLFCLRPVGSCFLICACLLYGKDRSS